MKYIYFKTFSFFSHRDSKKLLYSFRKKCPLNHCLIYLLLLVGNEDLLLSHQEYKNNIKCSIELKFLSGAFGGEYFKVCTLDLLEIS